MPVIRVLNAGRAREKKNLGKLGCNCDVEGVFGGGQTSSYKGHLACPCREARLQIHKLQSYPGAGNACLPP